MNRRIFGKNQIELCARGGKSNGDRVEIASRVVI